ncbi:MAG: ATP-dependent Clp protease ATP-binding subunit [Patescibacteria group bacterium]|nr:ATP-dependent Clp protease ATP-binding subunit [Patescibacteria group bacterium]
MSAFEKIEYFDLRLEAAARRLPPALGMESAVSRLNRILSRQLQHNAIIAAPSGTGKTALIYGWAKAVATNQTFAGTKLALLDASSLQKIGQMPIASLTGYQEAFDSLSNCVLIIDSFGEMIYQSLPALQNWNTLLKPLFFKSDMRLVLSMQPEELSWLQQNKSHFLSHFEILKLDPPTHEQLLGILRQAADKFSPHPAIAPESLELIAKLCERFPVLGQLPKSAIQLLDEAVADSLSSPGPDLLTANESIQRIVAEKTGIPTNRLSQDDKTLLRRLPQTIENKIIGQTPAVHKITKVIQRARLGLRSQNKPLGSFLCLGPSGVGKTETAKVLAETLYGSDKHFLRIDMSEFGESHATARLLGSPAGYVGFEDGGQLTNHFADYPYSLLLLDEIEKAHPKIFDIFLQILDDGRITSAQGQTVDLSQSVIMATSNLAVEEILREAADGGDIFSDTFLKGDVMDKLLKHFRMEFLNRFDAIVIFKPLSAEDLTQIALLEIKKIEERVRQHDIRFTFDQQTLKNQIINLADPRFGARPVKRLIEEACESLITETLLND